jgi:hypothetical protein
LEFEKSRHGFSGIKNPQGLSVIIREIRVGFWWAKKNGGAI